MVFCTENRERTIPLENTESLYKYIWGIVKNTNTKLYRINGTEDHIHMLTDLHPSVSLATFMQKVKTASSAWMKQTSDFPQFRGWAEGYAALTYSWKDKDPVIEYIKNQRQHHKTTNFMDEYRALLTEHGVEVDERYFP